MKWSLHVAAADDNSNSSSADILVWRHTLIDSDSPAQILE